MHAIIETGGEQVPVELNGKCKIPRLESEVGNEVKFDKVLLIADKNAPKIGKPYISGASVKGEVISHGKLDKVIIFKFKRRTKYRRKTGHRQGYTEVLIKAINS